MDGGYAGDLLLLLCCHPCTTLSLALPSPHCPVPAPFVLGSASSQAAWQERGVPGVLGSPCPTARQLPGNRLRLTPSAAPDSASPAFPSPCLALTRWPRGAGVRGEEEEEESFPARLASSKPCRRSRAEGSRWLPRGKEHSVLLREVCWIQSGRTVWKEGT